MPNSPPRSSPKWCAERTRRSTGCRALSASGISISSCSASGSRSTADWLLSCDRIALDCYQAYWNGLGKARPIPAPPPFCYMRTGFAPATFRRGIPLRRLGRQLNPFPIVQLPYHRLINPWTLGAMLHETSHNLQSELG